MVAIGAAHCVAEYTKLMHTPERDFCIAAVQRILEKYSSKDDLVNSIFGDDEKK